MPNTLAHIGVQAIATRGVARTADFTRHTEPPAQLDHEVLVSVRLVAAQAVIEMRSPQLSRPTRL